MVRCVVNGLSFLLCLCCVANVMAQQMDTPGAEHAYLKKLEGTWDAVVKVGPQESKAVATYTMELGGFWLMSDFDGEFAGMPFKGHGIDGYDQGKKAFVSVWVDSTSSAPMVSEGNLDATGKVLTMNGSMRGPTGDMMNTKMTTEMADDDHMTFTMYVPGPSGAETPMMTITYTRRK